MSRAGLNRKTALATATLVVAAEISDVDVLWAFGGPIAGLQHHRGWTHAFVGVPAMAALALFLVWGWNRLFVRKHAPGPGSPVALGRVRPPVRWKLLYGYACLGALSHILLDYTTSYGIRMFEPFSYRWYSWDTVYIVEPIMLLVLVAGLLVPSLFALVQEEIGARRPQFRGRGGAIFALAAIVVLWGVRDYQHRRAVAALEARLYQGADPLRAAAYPYPWNPFLWHGVVETQGSFETVQVDTLRNEVDPQDRARVYYKPEETPVLLAAKQSYLGTVYLDWAAYPMTETEPLEERDAAWRVRFFDLRYTYPETRASVLRASVDLDKNLHVVLQRFGRRVQK